MMKRRCHRARLRYRHYRKRSGRQKWNVGDVSTVGNRCNAQSMEDESTNRLFVLNRIVRQTSFISGGLIAGLINGCKPPSASLDGSFNQLPFLGEVEVM